MKRKHLTIVVSSPDDDGDYRVEIMDGLPHQALPEQGEYSADLVNVWPDSKEIKELLAYKEATE